MSNKVKKIRANVNSRYRVMEESFLGSFFITAAKVCNKDIKEAKKQWDSWSKKDIDMSSFNPASLFKAICEDIGYDDTLYVILPNVVLVHHDRLPPVCTIYLPMTEEHDEYLLPVGDVEKGIVSVVNNKGKLAQEVVIEPLYKKPEDWEKWTA